MKKIFALALIFIMSVLCITALADAPVLDEDELEIWRPESQGQYIASVTVNATGDGLAVGEYQLFSYDLDLVGLYYFADDENGSNKVLKYVRGNYEDRFNLGEMETISHKSGDYQMYRLRAANDWIPGTWTGPSLTNTIRDYRYEVFKYHLIPYNVIGTSYAEKLYAYTNDKETVLGTYAENFGTDSSVYSLINGYYGDLDAQGMAEKAAEIREYCKTAFEANVVRYAFEPDEIIPVNEMKTYNFTSWKQQGGIWVSSNIYAKATFYVAGTDGSVTAHSWTSTAFNINASGKATKHSVDVQSIEGLPTEGWIIGIELYPFAFVEDATKITATAYNLNSTTQSLRFLNTQFMPAIYPEEYVITGQAETPELGYDYINGKFVISITNANADSKYMYKNENGDWMILSEGKTAFETTETGYWFVKTVGTDTTADSAVACIKIDNVQPKPTLSLGEGNTLTAPDGVAYEIAKLGFNKAVEYQALTTATLTSGVWAVRRTADGVLAASEPQYFYIEGAKAGTAVYAGTSTVGKFVESRWAGTLASSSLFDFTYVWSPSGKVAYSTTKVDIYETLSVANAASKCSEYGYKYLFSDEEILPVSTLKDVTVTGVNTTKIYYDDANGTKTEITKGKALTRVYVVGAEVPYYDLYSDTDANKAFGSMPLSSLADKEGWVVAIEYFPLYEFYDANGAVITAPYITGATSYAIRFAPLNIVDETLVLNTSGYGHVGIVDGKNKFELILADKGEKPVLAVENKDGKYIIKVTNAGADATYQYKSENGGWITLAKGETSFEVSKAGTYTVKTMASGSFLASEAESITFEGVKPTPNLKPDSDNVITAPEGESYVYAQLGYGVTPDYKELTTATLTPGLWAVKALGNGSTVFDSEPQIIYVMGNVTGTVTFATKTGTTMTKGLWTGTTGAANLFDWDYYTNNDKKFTTTDIEIYTAFGNSSITNGTYPNYGYRYILKDSEIVPLSELVDLSATRKNFSNITCDGVTVEYTKTRARVHVVGGDAAYYDVITNCKFSTAPGFVFELSQLNDKKGYITAIELYLHHEFTDVNGNKLTGTLSTASSTSYGITFANISMNEGVVLANKNSSNTGLSADGENLYSIRIANDQRSPKFEALADNPNGIRITNYIQGEKYAYATSANGPWTEFEGDTVEFTAFGEYYIKLVGNDSHDDIINLKPFKTTGIMVEGTSLVLDGAIGIKVYFGAEETIDYTASYKVVNTLTGETILSNDNADVTSADGKLSLIVPVYPKDATVAKVIAIIKNESDGTSVTVETSIPEYISAIREMAANGDRECIDALDVIGAMETYALYAKNYFNKANEDMLPAVDSDLDAIAPAEIVDKLVGAKYHGTSLILDETTTIRHYFDVTDTTAFAKYTAYINEETVSPKFLTDNTGTTFAYYEIENIPAHKLGNRYTLELYGEDYGIAASVTYSVTNYIEKQINSDNVRLSNLMKTLYSYFEASDVYAPIAQNKGQRAEIWEAMTLAQNTTPAWKEVPAYAPTNDGYTHIKAITYDGFEYKGEKTKIFAYIGFPEGASADSPVPAIVLVHGGGGHPYAKWVKIWNDRGYAAIAMETTGYFPKAGTVCYTESENSNFVYGISGDFAEEGYGSAPSRSYPTTYTPVADQWAYHGLSQVILAGNILRADARVDADNIGITGVSWGGTMTSQVIGYDNRFSFAIPVYGTAYLGNEMHTFSNFNNEYVNSLWAAERNLDNATMPTFWFAYNDDNNFCVPAYYKSYMHTAAFNDKNSLLMLGNWSHSHGSVFNKNHPFWFADWVTFGKGGFVTFKDQPKGRNVNCTLNIPEGIEGNITAKVHYITEPMSYSTFDKFGWGSYKFLTPYWQTNTTCLTVDRATGKVSGTIPADAAGFYINIVYTIEGSSCETSSIYIPVDKLSTPENEGDWTWK